MGMLRVISKRGDFLAVVLFLTAISEKFQWNTVRAVILIVALGILLFGLYHLFTYPII
jgi:ABC-type transport system involved in cytochrome c biogenesis permease subunit